MTPSTGRSLGAIKPVQVSPSRLREYIVLYRPVDFPDHLPPLGFACHADDGDHAEEQCRNAYPDGEVVWVCEGAITINDAWADYFGLEHSDDLQPGAYRSLDMESVLCAQAPDPCRTCSLLEVRMGLASPPRLVCTQVDLDDTNGGVISDMLMDAAASRGSCRYAKYLPGQAPTRATPQGFVRASPRADMMQRAVQASGLLKSDAAVQAEPLPGPAKVPAKAPATGNPDADGPDIAWHWPKL